MKIFLLFNGFTLTCCIHCSTFGVSLANPPGVEVQSPAVLAKLQTPTTMCLTIVWVWALKKYFIKTFLFLSLRMKRGPPESPPQWPNPGLWVQRWKLQAVVYYKERLNIKPQNPAVECQALIIGYDGNLHMHQLSLWSFTSLSLAPASHYCCFSLICFIRLFKGR